MKSMFNTNPMKQKGLSLVELLLVLGVIALIAIAAFIIYPSVQASTQSNTESSNITAVVAATKNLYGARGNYGTGNITGTLVQARAFPSTMVGGIYTASTVPVNAWGASVTVAGAGTPVGTQFAITYSDIPTEACIKFVSGVAANFDLVGTVADPDAIKAAGQAPDPAAIVTACNAGLVNDIVFTSR